LLNAGDDDPQASMRAVFDWSYDTLSADAAHVLRRLGLVPAAKLTVESTAALAGIGVRAAAPLLDQLADRHLLIEQQPGWYEIHDLTRAYAYDLACRLDTQDERASAINRVRSWYVHTAQNVTSQIGEPHPTVALTDPVSGVVA